MSILKSLFRFHNVYTSFKQANSLVPWKQFIFDTPIVFQNNYFTFLYHTRFLTYYTKTHEYISLNVEQKDDSEKDEHKEKKNANRDKKVNVLERKKCRVGISKYGTEKLGEIVYVDIMHKTNDRVEKGECIAMIESVKSVGDVYSPISGIITGINDELIEEINLINKESENRGWLIELLTDDINEKEFLDFSEYEKFCQEEEQKEQLQAKENDVDSIEAQEKEESVKNQSKHSGDS